MVKEVDTIWRGLLAKTGSVTAAGNCGDIQHRKEYTMGFTGFVIVLVGALLLGILHRVMHHTAPMSEWLAIAVAPAIGGFIGSEWLGVASTWGPQVNGL